MDRPRLAFGSEAMGPDGAGPNAMGPDAVGPDAAGPVSSGGALSGVSFEKAIHRLGEIVECLEDGEQPLEESIALFEEGMTLAKSSQEILDRAERRIEELLGVDAQGRPVVRELEAD